MNASDTLALIEALKHAKASHFKSQDFEITFDRSEPIHLEHKDDSGWNQVRPEPRAEHPKSEPVQENKEATEKLKTLIETLKLPDDQLLDAIFPAGAGG